MKNTILKPLFVFSFFLSSTIFAQKIHPNDIRLEIYNKITNDIKSNLPHYLNKQILIDSSVPKYNDVNISTDGIILRQPEIELKPEICNFIFNVKCVNQDEIDNYELIKIYQNHVDTENIDFYGIYAPIDHWHQLILNTLKSQMLNDKPYETIIYIPVKHQYFEGEQVMKEMWLYVVELDKEFKINNFKSVKL